MVSWRILSLLVLKAQYGEIHLEYFISATVSVSVTSHDKEVEGMQHICLTFLTNQDKIVLGNYSSHFRNWSHGWSLHLTSSTTRSAFPPAPRIHFVHGPLGCGEDGWGESNCARKGLSCLLDWCSPSLLTSYDVNLHGAQIPFLFFPIVPSVCTPLPQTLFSPASMPGSSVSLNSLKPSRVYHHVHCPVSSPVT